MLAESEFYKELCVALQQLSLEELDLRISCGLKEVGISVDSRIKNKLFALLLPLSGSTVATCFMFFDIYKKVLELEALLPPTQGLFSIGGLFNDIRLIGDYEAGLIFDRCVEYKQDQSFEAYLEIVDILSKISSPAIRIASIGVFMIIPNLFLGLTDNVLNELIESNFLKSKFTAGEYIECNKCIRELMMHNPTDRICSLSDLWSTMEGMNEDSDWKVILNQRTGLGYGDATGVYTADDFLSEVYLSRFEYDRIISVLQRKKNIILQGSPGTGKTFAAMRLCFSLIGKKDRSKVEFVQFHSNYNYEDFVVGYRPAEDGEGFSIGLGVFYSFCKRAQQDISNDYYFIIDEINRGNLSKIFGELLMLIEDDKRDFEISLQYAVGKFYVPHNVFIIGMMNTADRSIALIDYALRRRFSFIDFVPAFDSVGFKRYQRALSSVKFDRLVATVKLINEDIVKDPTLGSGYVLGHSYLCNCDLATSQWLNSVVTYDILPLLREYWYDAPSKCKYWSEKLYEAIT